MNAEQAQTKINEYLDSLLSNKSGVLGQYRSFNSKEQFRFLQIVAVKISSIMEEYNLYRSQKEILLNESIAALNEIGIEIAAFVSIGPMYTKNATFVPPGRWTLDPNHISKDVKYLSFFNNQITSVFVTKQYQVALFSNGVNGVGKSYVVKYPGSINLGWHGFQQQVSSLTVEDAPTQEEADAIISEANSIRASIQSEQSAFNKVQADVNSFKSTIGHMQSEVDDMNSRLEKTKKMNEQIEKNIKQEDEIEMEMINSKDNQTLKAHIMNLESFTSMNDNFKQTNMTTTIILSTLVALLTITFIRITQN